MARRPRWERVAVIAPPLRATPAAPRLAILEANNFHEETVFAFLSAAARLPTGAEITVFAPDHWRSHEFARDDLGVACAWRPFAAFRLEAGELPFGAVVVNTFPSPAGQPTVEGALAAPQPVLGLVHDIEFFALAGGARAALERHPNLWLAHAGPAAPAAVARLPARLRRRIVRFFPVLRFDSPRHAPGEVATRDGVALPGALEYARRDFSSALRLTAETGIPLRIFGRSADHGDGPKIPRDLDSDRRRLLDEIAARAVEAAVEIGMDVSCGDFYRTVDRSRFVAVMPVKPEYLIGKLTGAVTAAVSCGVPMLALADIRACYTRADPGAFSRCMLAFDPAAPAGRGDDWGSIVRGTPADVYDGLCRATIDARDALLAENSTTIGGLLVLGTARGE